MDLVLEDRRREASWGLAVALLVVALGVRVLFLSGSADRDWPHSIRYEGDAPVWVEWAQALDKGQAFEFDLPVRTPGVAFMLHWLNPGILVSPFFWIKVAWCLGGALGCAALYMVLARSVNARVAIIANILLAFSFAQYVLATSLNNEVWYTLALVLIVGGTLRFNARPGLGMVLVLGVLHGAATLLRAEHTLLLIILAAYSALYIATNKGHDRRGDSESKLRRSWRAVLLVIMLIISVGVCLPWSVRSARAARAFNETTLSLPDYNAAGLQWRDEARAAVEALPAFARAGNVAYINHLLRIRGRVHVTVEDVEAFFHDEWGYVPEPITTWVLVSSKGPLDFALANHADATGGFSLAALRDAEGRNTDLSFGRPSHLQLYNHGYADGMRTIEEDPGRWMRLVGGKLRIFAEGITTGFTARNLPYGNDGVRRPVDAVTPAPGGAQWWRLVVAGMLLIGCLEAAHRRIAGIWLLVILYKVIVTILFYGYARQAMSIQPAFYVLAALGLDGILTSVEKRVGAVKRVVPMTGLLLGIALVGVDVLTAFRPQNVTAKPADGGVMREAPQFGPDAFLSHDELIITAD
jgi:hypothetical protein